MAEQLQGLNKHASAGSSKLYPTLDDWAAVEASRLVADAQSFAEQSRKIMRDSIVAANGVNFAACVQVSVVLDARFNLAFDCYFTGACEAIKRLTGDFSSEPWIDLPVGSPELQKWREDRVLELLQRYRLQREPAKPSSTTTGVLVQSPKRGIE